MAVAEPRYRAFVSYSHADRKVADWLHRSLEAYRVPAKLVGRETALGLVPARLAPVFRDRDELPAADDLAAAITAALAGSGHLVVICSPAAARSRWVDKEIAAFKRLHGDGRVLALVASGEPGSVGDDACFPPSLRVRFDASGPTDTPAEPIAADIRPGKDGRRLALLKLVAGLTGLGLDDLAQRDAQRRVRRLTVIAVAAVLGMLAAVGLAAYANAQRLEADRQRAEAQAQRRVAEREARAATSAADFLIGTFELSNPATENPRTISALTVLDRGAARARSELAGQPALQARLAETLGGAYAGLGLLPEAERAVVQSRSAIDRAGPEGAAALLRLANIYRQRGEADAALRLLAEVRRRVAGDTGRYRRLLGMAAVSEGRIHAARLHVKPAVRAFDAALEDFGAARDSQPGDVVTALREKGVLLADDGQFEAADAALLTALGTARRAMGDGHRRTAGIRVALAMNAFHQGKHALAAERLEPAMPVLRRVLDPANPILADAIMTQGRIELGQERYPAAVRSLRQAVGVYRTAFAKPHYLVGIGEVYLALAEGGRGDLRAAEAAFGRAKVAYDGSYGEEHPNHGDLMVNRATVLAKFGRKAAARAECAGGMEILRRTLGAEASYTKTMAATCAGIA